MGGGGKKEILRETPSPETKTVGEGEGSSYRQEASPPQSAQTRAVFSSRMLTPVPPARGANTRPGRVGAEAFLVEATLQHGGEPSQDSAVGNMLARESRASSQPAAPVRHIARGAQMWNKAGESCTSSSGPLVAADRSGPSTVSLSPERRAHPPTHLPSHDHSPVQASRTGRTNGRIAGSAEAPSRFGRLGVGSHSPTRITRPESASTKLDPKP